MQTNVPVKAAARPLQFVWLLAQLGLALAVIYLFEIEQRRGLPAVFALACGGFALHFWLPMKWRMPLFLAVSLASLPLVLEWQDALWVVGLGLGLIGICWLPVSGTLRMAFLLLAVANLAWWRSNSDSAFWPILGAMFMFRMIVYLFDSRNTGVSPVNAGGPPAPRDIVPTLSYFFLPPNVCFTLFPVIDYATFRRTYYDEEESSLYHTGVHWICRGLTHLLLYRWIKYHLLPAPHEVTDVAHMALFLAANYALYLRVSGQFHLITGLMHLFGFNLPRTHHLFFLATSFTDIWRRINIYWKDFLQKVIFFPAFFRLRRLGTVPAMFLATSAVFVATWLLHSYQVFWLLGEFPLTRNDATLWLAIGPLVAINALLDFRHAREQTRPPGWSWRRAAVTSLQAAGMFAAVSLFWGRWTYPDLFAGHPLLMLLGQAVPGKLVAWLAGVVLTIIVVGVAVQWIWRQLKTLEAGGWRSGPALAFGNFVVLLAVLVAGKTDWYRDQAPELAAAVASLKEEAYTPLEAGQVVQGYYEDITEANLSSDPFSGRGVRGKAAEHLLFSSLTRPTHDLRGVELIPDLKVMLEGVPFTTNRWGMRDRDVTKEKLPGTYRVALVGSSIVMGFGVGDDQLFSVHLQERLTAEQAPGGPKIELLNFGIGRHYAIQRWLVIEKKVFEFQPDAIFYFAHQDELYGTVRQLAPHVYAKQPMPSRCLDDVIRQAGIPADASQGTTEALLSPQSVKCVRCAYQAMVKACRSRGVLLVWVYLPMPGIAEAPTRSNEMVNLASSESLTTVDLSHWFEGFSPEQVKFSDGNHHATALGHQVIAQRLLEAIRQQPEILPAFKPADR